MFSLAFILLKMDTYSNDFENFFLREKLLKLHRDKIKSGSCQCKCSKQFSFSITRNYIKDQISKILGKDTCQNIATTSQIGQSHLGNNQYSATASQMGRFCLRTSETLQRYLKQVRVIDKPVETTICCLSMVQDVKKGH